MTQNIYSEPGQRGVANLRAVEARCGLCNDPAHTAGIAEQADGSWHVFSSREEQTRRIAAAKAANARIAAAIASRR